MTSEEQDLCEHCNKLCVPGVYYMCEEISGIYCEDCWISDVVCYVVHGEGCATKVFT